jgi:hypothetical protein
VLPKIFTENAGAVCFEPVLHFIKLFVQLLYLFSTPIGAFSFFSLPGQSNLPKNEMRPGIEQQTSEGQTKRTNG